VVAAGYADGYPKYRDSGALVFVVGQPGERIGRVSMDRLTVALTGHPGVGIGSAIELWGPRLPVAEVAARSGNSPYRLLTGLKRAPRQVVERA